MGVKVRREECLGVFEVHQREGRKEDFKVIFIPWEHLPAEIKEVEDIRLGLWNRSYTPVDFFPLWRDGEESEVLYHLLQLRGSKFKEIILNHLGVAAEVGYRVAKE